MGIIVKLLGSGLGMASEAIHDHRARSRSGQLSSSTPPSNGRSSPHPNAHAPSSSGAPSPSYALGPSSSSSSSPLPAPPAYADEAPPRYVEVADEATAQKLIRSGRAEPARDAPRSKAAEAGYYEDEEDGDDDGYEDAYSSPDEFARDAAAWELDDMAERVDPRRAADEEAEDVAFASAAPDSEEAKAKKEAAMMRHLLRMAGPPPRKQARLPCPVIIPQRRPRQKDRGFVHAYAPVLGDCGIQQDVFLQFLSDWHTASKASPWIDVVFVAAGVAGFVPSAAAQITSAVVQVAAGTARELQSRHRRNTFLDRANDELFLPRGLFAMVMAFKDEVPAGAQTAPLSRLSATLGRPVVASERLDLDQTAARNARQAQNASRLQREMRGLRLTSGTTYGEVELPRAAELVFPEVDRAARRDLQQTQQLGDGPGPGAAGSKWKSAGTWVQDYLDRRAQAHYEAEHPGSILAVSSENRRPLVSRFNDPNHPANSGSLIALLTGGAIDPDARRRERRAAKDERKSRKRAAKDACRVARGKSPRGPRVPRDERRRSKNKKKPGFIKKIMTQDVLYLVIVNAPTREEVQESVAQLEHAMAPTSGVSQAAGAYSAAPLGYPAAPITYPANPSAYATAAGAYPAPPGAYSTAPAAYPEYAGR